MPVQNQGATATSTIVKIPCKILITLGLKFLEASTNVHVDDSKSFGA